MPDPIAGPSRRGMAAPDDLYEEAARRFGPALARLAAAYEADRSRREDLVQEIHLQLWRSLKTFDGRASLRTWAFRVAHNVAVSHVLRDGRRRARERPEAEAAEIADPAPGPEAAAGRALAAERMHEAIRALPPLDAQVALLFLEDFSAAGIAEVTGLSAGAVATRLTRIRARLRAAFEKGAAS